MPETAFIKPAFESDQEIPEDLLPILDLFVIDTDQLRRHSGVYFLVRDKKVIYVGKTVSLISVLPASQPKPNIRHRVDFYPTAETTAKR